MKTYHCRHIASAVLAALVIATWAASSTAHAQIIPVKKATPLNIVIGTAPPRILFSTDNTAALVFNTTVPLDINVFYGRWPEVEFYVLGAIQGGVSHSAFLPDLHPNQVYLYHIVGVAPDGRTYRSEDYRFITPDFPDQSGGGGGGDGGGAAPGGGSSTSSPGGASGGEEG